MPRSVVSLAPWVTIVKVVGKVGLGVDNLDTVLELGNKL